LGIPHLNVNDDAVGPMSAVFSRRLQPWSYTAIVPPILYTTQLPLPPQQLASMRAAAKPAHTAAYWAEKTKGMNFAVEDKLDTKRFNAVLWHAFRGENVPYPANRDGRNLRKNRQTLLSQQDR